MEMAIRRPESALRKPAISGRTDSDAAFVEESFAVGAFQLEVEVSLL